MSKSIFKKKKPYKNEFNHLCTVQVDDVTGKTVSMPTVVLAIAEAVELGRDWRRQEDLKNDMEKRKEVPMPHRIFVDPQAVWEMADKAQGRIHAKFKRLCEFCRHDLSLRYPQRQNLPFFLIEEGYEFGGKECLEN